MKHMTQAVNSQDFSEQVLNSSLPVLVDFTADWCPPCKMIAPLVAEIAHKYEGQLTVRALDSDLNPDITQEYGVMGLPTLILFQNGQPVERIVGYVPREKIEAKVLPYLQPQNV